MLQLQYLYGVKRYAFGQSRRISVLGSDKPVRTQCSVLRYSPSNALHSGRDVATVHLPTLSSDDYGPMRAKPFYHVWPASKLGPKLVT